MYLKKINSDLPPCWPGDVWLRFESSKVESLKLSVAVSRSQWPQILDKSRNWTQWTKWVIWIWYWIEYNSVLLCSFMICLNDSPYPCPVTLSQNTWVCRVMMLPHPGHFPPMTFLPSQLLSPTPQTYFPYFPHTKMNRQPPSLSIGLYIH